MIVQIIYDKLTNDTKAQIVRDLLVLRGECKIELNPKGLESILSTIEMLNINLVKKKAGFLIVYKYGDAWPEFDESIKHVERDMKPEKMDNNLDLNEHVVYVPDNRGVRNGVNLTELYLNRNYPRGKGVTNPWVPLILGP